MTTKETTAPEQHKEVRSSQKGRRKKSMGRKPIAEVHHFTNMKPFIPQPVDKHEPKLPHKF